MKGYTTNSGRISFLILLGVAIVVLGLLFRDSFHPDKVIFSNDGPLGVISAASFAYPQILTGAWFDLNWLGFNGGAASPNITAALVLALKPLYYAKFLAPLSILFLGICAWVFFHRLGFSTGPAVLASLAMMLNSNIFSNVCWGLGSRALTVGLFFLAMAVIVPGATRLVWARIILSGLCIGMAVMEGADNGVIFSFYLSAFILFYVWNQPGKPVARLAKGALKVAVVAIFAGVIATQAIISLYGVAIKNVAGASAATEHVRSKTENWDWATQWSLPKAELMRVIIPGLYGYRMEGLENKEGGNYWGAVGRTPGWEQTKAGIPRHSGAGEYAGVLVVLVAIWSITQAARKEASVYSALERRWIWFWAIAAFISILLAVGRYAPFYQVLYALPYFSAIRNPMKFMHPCHVSLVILFAYGVQGIVRRYLDPAKARTAAPAAAGWWAALPGFEKKWVVALGALAASSLLGWMIYSTSRSELEKHLMEVGFGDPALARQIAGFSIGEVGRFVLFALLSAGVLLLVVKGTFAGTRARLGLVFMGLLVVVDLARANTPWIKAVDYKQKYAPNALVEVLRQQPHEHRVTMSIPFRLPPEYGQLQNLLHQIYGMEWMQHVFPYYDVQSLDVTQLSRRPEDYVQFEERTFAFNNDPQRSRLQDRHWELTNTRYIIGMAAYLGGLNDIGPGRFRIHSRYDLAPKPGVSNPRVLEELTVLPKEEGAYALFELTNALPRAKLYSQWQVITNDQETLARLADENFDIQNTLLLSEPLAGAASQPPANTNSEPASARIISYRPKRIEITATNRTPALLLVNDKWDPDWKVRVDGKPERLLRVNYLMRGVFLGPGNHTVVLSFEPTLRGFYVSLAGITLGVILGVVLLLASLRRGAPKAS